MGNKKATGFLCLRLVPCFAYVGAEDNRKGIPFVKIVSLLCKLIQFLMVALSVTVHKALILLVFLNHPYQSLALYDLKGFFEYYLEQRPEVDNDELSIIIDALVSVLQARNGVFLLQKLANMDSADIDTLNDILDEWSISDIKDVLEEIDNRLKVINAIEQLCSDPTTDELHVLHPLVSQAKWLFGIEYDNLNYTFNRQLTTVMQSG